MGVTIFSATAFFDFFISYIAVYTVLLPLIAAFYNFKYLPAPSKALLGFLLLSGCTDVLIGFLLNAQIDTTWLLHVYTLAEYLFLSVFFYRIYPSPAKRKFVIIIGLAFVLLSAINTLFFQPLTKFNTYTRSLEGLLMVVFCFIYFDQESRVRQTIRWEKKPYNWYVTGLFVYFAGAFFFFLFSNLIVRLSIPTQFLLWFLHGVLQVIMYISIAAGYLNERAKQ